jgi:hypothetical protein
MNSFEVTPDKNQNLQICQKSVLPSFLGGEMGVLDSNFTTKKTSRDRCYIFINILAEKLGEKLAFLLKSLLFSQTKTIITLIFKETTIFSTKIGILRTK